MWFLQAVPRCTYSTQTLTNAWGTKVTENLQRISNLQADAENLHQNDNLKKNGFCRECSFQEGRWHYVKPKQDTLKNKHGSYQTNITEASSQLGNLRGETFNKPPHANYRLWCSGLFKGISEVFWNDVKYSWCHHRTVFLQQNLKQSQQTYSPKELTFLLSLLCVWQFLCHFSPLTFLLRELIAFVCSGVVYLSCGLASSLPLSQTHM